MRIETELARPAVSRLAAWIVLGCTLALPAFACPARATTPFGVPRAHARRERAMGVAGSGLTLAFEEQSLPPEDLPSPAPPQPAAQASPDDTSGWTRMPAQPDGAGQSGTPGSSAPSGVSDSVPASEVPAPASSPVAGEPAPVASPTEAPPPYDVGSLQPVPPVSDQPLTALIDSTKDEPALNASLHLTEQARQALEASRLDDAMHELGQAVSIDPTDPYAYFYLGRAYMMKNNYQQALAFFGRAEVGLSAIPAWLGEVKGFEGVCLEEQSQFSKAAEAYKQALAIAPGNLMARTGYGRLSENLSDTNAGSAAPPPPPLDGAALPAPQADLAAPAPHEDAPPPAGLDQSDSGGENDGAGASQ